MQLFIKSMTGKTFVLDFETGATVLDLRLRVQKCEGAELDHFRLIYGGTQLDDDNLTLEEAGLQKEATIHVAIRLRGQGDMLRNHISSVTPAINSKCSINDPVVVVLDNQLTLAGNGNTQCIKVFHKDTGIEIEGVVLIANINRIVITFAPANGWTPNTRYKVILYSRYFLPSTLINTFVIHADSEWYFTTNNGIEKMIVTFAHGKSYNTHQLTLANNENIFKTFVESVAKTFSIDPLKIKSMEIRGTSVHIENNVDLLELKSTDIVDINFDDSKSVAATSVETGAETKAT